jgi:hypothetical protein
MSLTMDNRVMSTARIVMTITVTTTTVMSITLRLGATHMDRNRRSSSAPAAGVAA